MTHMGDWILEEQIGVGGMGVVWKARHARTGQRAAVKTVHALAPHSVAALRREVRALARLDHPGVVSILDEALDDEVPWYAMALVKGSSLRDWGGVAGATTMWMTGPRGAPTTTDALYEPGGPELRPVDDVLQMGVLVCEPLAALHAEGLVHRDLKPDNVIVDLAGRPVLVDFGLAARFSGPAGREILDRVTGLASGTLGYVAPEQARGEIVDARADLYALGAMLYELLTGRVPFPQGRFDIHTALMPASYLVPGLPEAIDDLLARLLAFAPTDRIGFAEDVAMELAAIVEQTPGWLSRKSDRTHLYRSRLHGRGAEQFTLAKRVSGLADGRGGVVAVVGRSGIGKSRLVAEAAREATYRVKVLVGGAFPGCGPLEPLAGPMREVLDIVRADGAEACERVLGARGPVLAPWFEGIIQLPGQADYTEPVALPRRESIDRLCSALSLVLELVDEEPVALILDDLHWADELTLEFVQYVADLDPQRLLVVATWRSEEQSEALARLRDSAEVLELGPLSESAITGLVTDMLGMQEPDRKLVHALLPRVEGMPLIAAEYVRAAADLGWLQRDRRLGWKVTASDASLPHTLADLIRLRMEAVGHEAREVVDAAAILGREVSDEVLALVDGRDREAHMAAIQDLTRRHVLSEIGGGRLCFTHDKLREVALAELDGPRARALHGRAAAALAAHGAAPALVARHWDAAGEPERAAPWHLEAGREAVQRFAVGEAERHLSAFLEVAADEAEGVRARNLLAASVYQTTGRAQRAIDLLETSLARAEALGDQELLARTLERFAHTLFEQGSTERALTLARRAAALATSIGARDVAVMAELRVTSCLMLTGRLAEAEEGLRALLEVVSRTQLDTQASITLHLGIVRAMVGDLEDAEALFRRSADLARRGDHPSGLARAQVNLGKLYVQREQFDGAVQWFADALPTLRQIGDRRAEAHVLDSLGDVERAMGRLEVARQHFTHALATAERFRHLRLVGHVRRNLALLCLEQGDPTGALAHLEAALVACDIPLTVARVTQTLAVALAALGRVDEARVRHADADAGFASAGTGPEREEGALEMARIERHGGAYDHAEALSRASLARSQAAGFVGHQVQALAELGFLALARGHDATPFLAAAAPLRAATPAPYRPFIDRLEAAAAARARGEPLRHGEMGTEA